MNLDPRSIVENTEIGLMLGRLYEQRGEKEVAGEMYREAGDKFPTNQALEAARTRLGF